MLRKKLKTSRLFQVYLGIFMLSLLALITISVVSYLTEIEANYYNAAKLFSCFVVINSAALLGAAYEYKKSIVLAVALALLFPAFHFGYPALADYIDIERAKHNPNSFYYESD